MQKKEASRELHHRVNGSNNDADMFKVLDHDSIARHTDAMGCEFMSGSDPTAFTLDNLSGNVSEQVQDKWKNGLAQQNLQHHTQRRTDLERRCIQRDCRREEW